MMKICYHTERDIKWCVAEQREARTRRIFMNRRLQDGAHRMVWQASRDPATSTTDELFVVREKGHTHTCIRQPLPVPPIPVA